MNDQKLKTDRQKGRDLQMRTESFALRIVKLSQFLEKNRITGIIAKQPLRSGTSVAANYRTVCRAKPEKGFINKLAIIIEEIDKTRFWLELLSRIKFG